MSMSELNESTEHPNQLHQIQLYDHIIGSLIHYQVLKLHVHFHHCMTMHFAKVANSSKKYKFAKFAIEMSTKPRTTLGDRCRPYARHFSPNNSGEVGEAEKNLGHINLAR